ncbi:hypothetical protein ANCDUO_14146, partial [Ancylostoma duodenale]
MINTLPANVKSLFPKENLEFADSITESESKILKERREEVSAKVKLLSKISREKKAGEQANWKYIQVFDKHACFEQVGEMIDAVEAKSAELGKRMRA